MFVAPLLCFIILAQKPFVVLIIVAYQPINEMSEAKFEKPDTLLASKIRMVVPWWLSGRTQLIIQLLMV